MRGETRVPCEVEQWFRQTDGALLNNKIVRDYLKTYNMATWPEAVKLTLLYGIACLRSQYRMRSLSLEELKEVVGQGFIAVTVEQNLPALEQKVDDLREKLDVCQSDLVGDHPVTLQDCPQIPKTFTAPPNSKGGGGRSQSASKNKRPNKSPVAGKVPNRLDQKHERRFSKPNSEWRQGAGHRSPERVHQEGGPAEYWKQPNLDEAAPRQHPEERVPARPQASIVPEWWPDDGKLQKAPQPTIRQPSKAAPRAQPRLAYSKPPATNSGAQPYDDDLVTPAYLNVGSSGYGGPPSGAVKVVGRERPNQAPARKPAQKPCPGPSLAHSTNHESETALHYDAFGAGSARLVPRASTPLIRLRGWLREEGDGMGHR
ncbi:hypothetical protein CYMTET_32379 [Cymbomonas tetramitiformis]|uniref:Uncharacterized protein n=1 Tax=Cymbomonas tetramitiformis TaxID=36881 RepID=A0AAE0FEZ4_9CHLO|nr:hypothetical protein CYMTET_32379 [Cymbomonas tetramitiformis]